MTTPSPRRIAIIGGGASGVLLAASLLRQAGGPRSISMVEPAERLGRGVAYATTSPLHLLNVRASNMSALPDDPDHFLRWAVAHLPGAGITADSFVPRADYGVYLRDVLDAAAAEARGRADLEWLRAAAVGVTLADGRIAVALSDGSVCHADHVALALGNSPPGDLPFLAGVTDRARLISGFDGDTIAERVAPDEPVLLVGSGLTMVDVVLSLRAAGHAAPIAVVSRHGLLPLSHRPRQPYPQFLEDGAPALGVRELLRQLRAEVRRAAEAGYPWQSVVDALRPVTQRIWVGLSLDERRRFLRHLRTYWDVHRHRIAPEVAAVIDELRVSGRLRVYTGRVVACREEGDGLVLELAPRGGGPALALRAGRVINCTGPAYDYARTADPLIAGLRAQGLLRADALNLGIDADPDGRLLGADGRPSPFLSTLGPPLRAALWECTAVPDIRVTAAALARRLAAGEAR